MLNFHVVITVIFSSSCILTAAALSVPSEQQFPTSHYPKGRTHDVTSYETKASTRQNRSFFKKLGFFSGYKIGSSLPSQSSGQLIATHNGNFFGKFLNANIRLIYGSQPLLTGGVGVIPTVTSVAGPLKGGTDTSAPGSEKVSPGFILITTRRDPSVNATKNGDKQAEDKISVESILIPIFERVPEVPAGRNQSATSTTEKSPTDNTASPELPANNDTSTNNVFIL